MSERQEVCPKCERPLATRDDFSKFALNGKCPTGYAIRDPDAANDCEEWHLMTPGQRSIIEYANQQIADLQAKLEAIEAAANGVIDGSAFSRDELLKSEDNGSTNALLRRLILALHPTPSPAK